MSPLKRKVALVTGANGITGNAIIEYLIRQPSTEWTQIIITSRRPPTNTFWQDPRIHSVALDFLKPVDDLVQRMTPLCENDLNVPLFENFLLAIDKVAGKALQRVCLQTGGKYYGVHLGPVEAPIHEEMQRYEDRGENFYYPQEDFLCKVATERSWDWNVIRPNAIIGFTPAGNGMSAALTLAMYFLCCQEMGEVPIFPGNNLIYNSVDDCSFAPSLAHMNVWSATEDIAKNEAFNHTNGDVFVWKYFWRRMGSYFGVETTEVPDWKASGADQQHMSHNFLMTEWAKDKKPVWQRVVCKHGGNPDAFDWGTWDFFDWITGKTWPTIGTVSKARKFGWQRYDDTVDTYLETFRSFENAGILPPSKTSSNLSHKHKPLRPHPAVTRAQP